MDLSERESSFDAGEMRREKMLLSFDLSKSRTDATIPPSRLFSQPSVTVSGSYPLTSGEPGENGQKRRLPFEASESSFRKKRAHGILHSRTDYRFVPTFVLLESILEACHSRNSCDVDELDRLLSEIGECERISLRNMGMEKSDFPSYDFENVESPHFNWFLSVGSLELTRQRNVVGYPLGVATLCGNLPIVKILLKHGFDVDGPRGSGSDVCFTPLFAAAYFGDAMMVQELCRGGANVNYCLPTDGSSVLYAACRAGSLATVIELGCFGADPMLKKKNGMTALHVACQNGHLEVVKFLLNYGAEIDAISASGSTPLHLASYQKQKDVVRLLADHGAHVDAKDENGWTPIHIAAQTNSVSILDMLLKSQLLPDSTLLSEASGIATEILNCSFLDPAIFSDEVIENLKRVAKGERAVFSREDVLGSRLVTIFRLNRRKSDGYSVLLVAARTVEYGEICNYILGNGGVASITLDDNVTVLMVAAKVGHLGLVRLLCDRFPIAELRAGTSSQHWTAIHWAAKGGFVNVVRFLLNLRVQQGDESVFGVNDCAGLLMTPLYIACHHGHLDLVKVLLNEFRANLEPLERMLSFGQTVMLTAAKHGHDKVVKYLISFAKEAPQNDNYNALADSPTRIALARTLTSPMNAACKYGHVSVVKVLVEEGGVNPLEDFNVRGWASVHWAVRFSSMNVLEYFCGQFGAKNIGNCRTKSEELQGYYPFHIAIAIGKLDLVRYLLQPRMGCKVDSALAPNQFTALSVTREGSVPHIQQWLNRAKDWSNIHFFADIRDLEGIRETIQDPTFDRSLLWAPTKESNCTPLSLALKHSNTDPSVAFDSGISSVETFLPVEKLRGFKSNFVEQMKPFTALPDFSVEQAEELECLRLITAAMLPLTPGTLFAFPSSAGDEAFTFALVNNRCTNPLPLDMFLNVITFLG